MRCEHVVCNLCYAVRVHSRVPSAGSSRCTGTEGGGCERGKHKKSRGRGLKWPSCALETRGDLDELHMPKGKDGVIYKLTSPSGKGYVGQTQQEVSKRMWAHCNSTRCHAIAAAITKYGWENIKVEILLSDVPKEVLNAEEDRLIELHGTLSPGGYNLNRPSKQPRNAGNHANLKAAVRAFNVANPELPKAKQNGVATVKKRRDGWKKKREKRCAGMTAKEKWAEYVRARASAKRAAKLAAMRCAGTGRDPMVEWEAEYGSDTSERKAHVAFQRRVRGCAKGDSSRRRAGSLPPASSVQGRETNEQKHMGKGLSVTGVPKSPPSCASTGWVSKMPMAPSDDESEDSS